MTSFERMIADAQAAGVEARAERRRAFRPGAGRPTVKTLVEKYLGEQPDVDKIDLIRRVLCETGLEDSGAFDALTDDELSQIIATGNRVLAVHRKHSKGGSQ